MEIGIDVIGDLFLSPDDEFNWDGKPTSLYCIVTGNVGNDIGTLYKTLDHLSDHYKGVFYVSGSYEFEDCDDIRKRVDDINYTCQQVKNVASLWHHVVILENAALVGCNGWLQRDKFKNHIDEITVTELAYEDLAYMRNSVSKLQKHADVKNMIVISNSVPSTELYFGEQPEYNKDQINLDSCLSADTEHKVSTWVYGSYGKAVDYKTNGITYISNPYKRNQPYWPKRIIINI
jgi:predicted mannosyl-3-phosphoglycerate phosphatase (HAD superfamily)